MEMPLKSVRELPTVKRALPNQRSPRQLQRPLVRASPSDRYGLSSREFNSNVDVICKLACTISYDCLLDGTLYTSEAFSRADKR
jgi:hypothetical protein